MRWRQSSGWAATVPRNTPRSPVWLRNQTCTRGVSWSITRGTCRPDGTRRLGGGRGGVLGIAPLGDGLRWATMPEESGHTVSRVAGSGVSGRCIQGLSCRDLLNTSAFARSRLLAQAAAQKKALGAVHRGLPHSRAGPGRLRKMRPAWGALTAARRRRCGGHPRAAGEGEQRGMSSVCGGWHGLCRPHSASLGPARAVVGTSCGHKRAEGVPGATPLCASHAPPGSSRRLGPSPQG